jgi:hypothetical protein
MLYTEGSVSGKLDELIQNHRLDSQLDSWLDSMREAKDGFYAKALVSFGYETAEQKLREWVETNHAAKMASAPHDVAVALLELAKYDEERKAAQPADAKKPYKSLFQTYRIDETIRLAANSRYNGGLMILADNPYVPGCGCSQPKGSATFGRGGDLGLRKIGVRVDAHRQAAELILVLPLPDFRTVASKDAKPGYSAITIDTQGMASGYAVSYYLYQDAIDYALGITPAEKLIGGSNLMSGINAAITFPGGTEYLESRIAQLPEYITAAAATLSGQHSH